MIDPPPLPATPSSPPPLPVRISWHRVRLYCWSILLVLAIYFYGAARLVREQPKRAVENVLARLPFPASVGEVTWLTPDQLQLNEVKLGDFFYAYSVIVTATVPQLMHHRVTQIDVHGPQIYTKPLNDALSRGGSGGQGQGLDWIIDKLIIRRGTLMLDDLAPGMQPIPVRLGVVQPIILNRIQLGKPDSSPGMTREQTAEIENVNIISPFDPLVPVLSFPLTRIRFTYEEIWHHKIREIDLVRPVIHLGQDLFWFSDEFKKSRSNLPAQGPRSPWQVDRFQVQYGQLAINVFGQPKVVFPFFFETVVNNIRLDQLDKISAKSVVAIRRLDQDYPDYKIKIVDLQGKLEFNIPPTKSTANNVVPTVYIEKLSWNGIAATQVWSSVTFDPSGVYGKLGGNCEKGYLKGNFEFYYTKGFTWNVNMFADKIDCQPIAARLAGKYFSLTGTLDGQIGVQGKATAIVGCKGKLGLDHPGLLEIRSLDDLLKRLPADAGPMQRTSLKIAIGALRSYPYRTGELKLDYTPAGGVGTLKLDSPDGKRDFAVYLHPYESSKVANAGDSR